MSIFNITHRSNSFHFLAFYNRTNLLKDTKRHFRQILHMTTRLEWIPSIINERELLEFLFETVL